MSLLRLGRRDRGNAPRSPPALLFSRRASGRAAAAAVVLGGALASGCSTVGVAYDTADWMMLGKLDKYADLTWAQRRAALDGFDERMRAHGRDELPEAIRVLRTARSMAADGLTAAEIEWIAEAAEALYRTAVDRTIPYVSPYFAVLDAKQIAHMSRAFDRRNVKYRRNYLGGTRDERIAARTEWAIERIEEMVGPLRPEQIALVERRRRALPEPAADWLAYHMVEQRRLVALLEAGASEPEIADHLAAWWVHLANRDPRLVRESDVLVDGWKDVLLALDATLDARQRAHLLAEIDALIETLSEYLPDTAASAR